jgi:CBS domain containing-hemolysin-like protein
MRARAQRPFASRMHVALVVLMLVSFGLIAQQTYKAVYQLGFVLLVASTFVQIVFGNIAPATGFASSMRQLALGLAIIAAIFGLGVLLTPLLVNLGRSS